MAKALARIIGQQHGADERSLNVEMIRRAALEDPVGFLDSSPCCSSTRSNVHPNSYWRSRQKSTATSGRADTTADGLIDAAFSEGAGLRAMSTLSRRDYTDRIVRGAFAESVARTDQRRRQ